MRQLGNHISLGGGDYCSTGEEAETEAETNMAIDIEAVTDNAYGQRRRHRREQTQMQRETKMRTVTKTMTKELRVKHRRQIGREI